MKMILTGFSEEISLENPQAINFLVFDCNGEVLRVPVGSETIQVVAAHYYKNASKKPDAMAEKVEPRVIAVQVQEEEPEEPDEEFEEEEDFEEEDEEGLQAVTLAPPSNIPKSEAEVPSL